MSYEKYAKILRAEDELRIVKGFPSPFTPKDANHAREIARLLPGPIYQTLINEFDVFTAKARKGTRFILMTPVEGRGNQTVFDPHDLLERAYMDIGPYEHIIYVTRKGKEVKHAKNFWEDEYEKGLKSVDIWTHHVPGLLDQDPMQEMGIIYQIVDEPTGGVASLTDRGYQLNLSRRENEL